MYMYIGELGRMLVGDDWGSKLEMIHDTSRLNDQLQQDSSQSSSFAAYETASVRTRIDRSNHRYHLFKLQSYSRHFPLIWVLYLPLVVGQSRVRADLITRFVDLIDWLSMVLRLNQHNIGYTADGFYRSDDPTNSVKALKEGG